MNFMGDVAGNGRSKLSGSRLQHPTHEKVFKLYGIVTLFSWVPLLFYYLLMVLVGRKYRSNFMDRMGLKLPKRLPPGRRIWFHALSVGETLSVVPLVKAVRRICPDLEIVFSTATEAGRVIAGKRLAGDIDRLFYMPHDFPGITDLLVQRLHPDMFVLVETDIWPNLLHSLKSRSICTALVNARLSPRSAERFAALSPYFSPFCFFDLIFPQSSQDKEYFLALGAAPTQIEQPGNLKIDSLSPPLTDQEKTDLRSAAGIAADRLVWIAGSTHPGEEAILLRVHQELRRAHGDLLLIIAPRQIGRREEVAALASKLNLATGTRSRGTAAGNAEVYLLDTLGELGKFYAVADVAFIGGSLVPFGGHNPLEAVAQRKPCLWGPHLFNFRELESKLLAAGCALLVSSEDELLIALHHWLGRASRREQMGRNAEMFLASSTGCAQRIAEVLCKAMDCGKHRHP